MPKFNIVNRWKLALLTAAASVILPGLPKPEGKPKTRPLQVESRPEMDRSAGQAMIARGAAKERAIGVDPKYLHSTARRFALPRRDWIKAAAKWDLDNPIEKWRWR